MHTSGRIEPYFAARAAAISRNTAKTIEQEESHSRPWPRVRLLLLLFQQFHSLESVLVEEIKFPLSTAAWVYSPAEGTGRTIIGETTYEWTPQDVFVVPAWYPHRHEADDDAFLFSFSDKPVHDQLGWFREVRGNA